MALIWADGFDHYGTTPNGGRDLMLSGAWGQFAWGTGDPPEVSTTQKRTGGYSLKMPFNWLGSTGLTARRVIGSTKTVIGVAFGIYMNSLPTQNNIHGLEIRDNSNVNIVRLTVESDGSIGIRKGAGGTAIGASDPCITAEAWNHIEIKAVIDSVVGSVEVRVNSVVVLNLTNQNLGSLGTTQLAWISSEDGLASLTWYIDDIIVWDDTTAFNNAFFGPQRVTLIFADADTATADWSKVGDTDGFDCIDNVPPDGDTTYIAADVVNEVSEFELPTLPPETATIAGVYVPVLAKLEDAGIGNIQVSLKSAAALSDGPSQVLTTAYTYYGVSHPLDPNTSALWTKANLEAAKVRVKKTV